MFLNPEVRKSHRMRTALAAANFDPFSYRLATWLSNSSGGVLVCVLAGDREGGSLLVLTGRRILALPEVLPVTLLDLEPRACSSRARPDESERRAIYGSLAFARRIAQFGHATGVVSPNERHLGDGPFHPLVPSLALSPVDSHC